MRRTMACAVLSALAVATAVAVPAAASGDFYTPPDEVPEAQGELIRTAPLDLAVSVDLGGAIAPLPATATRLLYSSLDETGEPVAVSGSYLEPEAPWLGSGDRPLVSFSVGTQGQGDACAPSKTLESGLVIDPEALAVGYEIPFIYGFLQQGIAVVVTDYVGLGTTDRLHSYVNRLDSGRAVLDAARAASALPGATVTADSPVGLYGYSQGGGAAASAAELAPAYAPELDVVGAYAGAPPADLVEVMKSADDTSLTGVIGWALNGLLQYHPEMAAALESEISEDGWETLERLSTACIGDAVIATGTAFASTSEWTTSGESLAAVAARIPAVQEAVGAQRIGGLTPTAPVRIVTGTQDDIVDHGQARQLALDWCASGADVSYVPVPQLVPSGGTGLNHLTPAITRSVQSTAWMVDRLRGLPAWSNCGLVRLLP
ncbi:lipase family protein [Demequina pelophila]|uniref:lipase family protein n=1 Tax=Demequina pelophila TaxID=1638984 RepID=UPI0007851E84|nr:lipase family protein [Demequina pelophila]